MFSEPFAGDNVIAVYLPIVTCSALAMQRTCGVRVWHRDARRQAHPCNRHVYGRHGASDHQQP